MPINILTAGELYGDRVKQVDMRIAKLLRFGRTAHQRRARRLQPVQLERAARLRHHLRRDLGQRPNSVLDARFAKVSAQFDF